MGNSTSRVVGCFVPAGNGKNGVNLEFLEPLDEGLGHSFCYVRPVIADSPAITPSNSERYTLDSSTLDSETYSGSFRQEMAEDLTGLHRPNKNFSETTFRTISGASVSANVSTARTVNQNVLSLGDAQEPAASFESTASFAAIPLQPVPRGSGPLNGFLSGPLERGFASGPLERGAGFMSGPLDKGTFMSGPLDNNDRTNFSAPLAYVRRRAGFGQLVRSMSRPMRSAFSRTFTRHSQGSGWMHRILSHPMTQFVWHPKEAKFPPEAQHGCVDVGTSEPEYNNNRNLQWAHGKAGEDRVHVVLSEEQGWLFVGIYDGFSGPDAPDFLMSNLYKAIDKELEGLLWDYDEKAGASIPNSGPIENHATATTIEGGYQDHQLEKDDSQISHPHDECISSPRDKVVTPSISKSEDKVGVSHIDEDLDKEPGKVDETLDHKEANKNDNELQAEGTRDCKENTLGKNRDNISNIEVPERQSSCVLETKLASQCRRSKRLYELLQMELLEDLEKVNSLTSDTGSRRGSWDLQSGVSEDLFSRDSLAVAAEPTLCSSSIKTERTNAVEETGGLRESDGTQGTDSKEDKHKSAASFSALGHKYMIKRSLLHSKLRKMYRKQKSLRKKLFPWSYDWHRDQSHSDERILGQSVFIRRCRSGPVDHSAVLKAMTRALETTEEAYMDMVEKTLDKNPELALMGSCVLVMLMKDQDVYVMNLGDSRVILAQDRLNDRYNNPNLTKDDIRHRNRSRDSLVRVELDRISEESPVRNPKSQSYGSNKNRELSLCRLKMRACQFSTDHSTSIEEEVVRIKMEHADDAQAVFNDRVKGQLKVTRAFGAGFLKKPKFNEALLEMFRIDYVGNSPYVSCIPSVHHHHLCSSDRFLVLSSDGLYQYFSNEEVVSHVAWFMENMPEGDPAQYLIAELLLRAAKKNGMDFHELLDIPHGDRRKYHDDVSVMVISLEGRIWRSSG